MRALSLELTAFGPYREKQRINFTDLGDEPIFLITGPTGAGKTTIFDAICFSLYGKANGTDRDQDGFRSHFANVSELTSVSFTFVLHQKTYCVMRSPKQQKPKARGEGYTEEAASASLYVYNHEQQWELIVSKIKDVNETIEEMIGLDYEQFKKMIMIPQGEFRKLISENSKEREEVLQKIFRTYFYKNMTEKLKEEAKSLKEQWEKRDWQYQQELEKLPDETIDPDSHKKVKEQLEDRYLNLEEKKASLNKELDQVSKQLSVFQEQYYQQKKLVDHFHEYEQLLDKQNQLQLNQKEIDTLHEKLELAKTAEKIKPIEELMQTRKQEWQFQHQKFEDIAKQQKDIQILFEQSKVKYEEEQKKEKERESLQFQLKEHQQLLAKMDEFETTGNELNKLDETFKSTQEKQTLLENKIKELDKKKETSYEIRDKIHESDSTLQKLKHEIEQLRRKATNMQDLKKEYQELLVLRKDYQQYKNVADKLQTAADAQAKRCEQLEQERKKHFASHLAASLDDGNACPVCGSIHHPDLAKIKDSSISDELMDKETKSLTSLQEETQNMQMTLLQIKEQGEGKKQLVTRLIQSLEMDKEQITHEQLQQIDTSLLESIQHNKKESQKHQHTVQELQSQFKQIQTAMQDYDRLKQELARIQEKQQEISKDYHKVHAQYSQLKAQLPDGVESPTAFKQQVIMLEQELNKKMQQWKDVQAHYEKAIEDKNKAETKYQEANQFTNQLKQKSNEQEKKFNQALVDYQFVSITEYKQALLPLKKQQEIANDISKHDEQKNVVKNRLINLAEWIKDVEKPDLTKLEEKIADVEKDKDEKNKQMQSIAFHIDLFIATIRKTNELEKQMKEINDDYFHIGELADLARGDNTARLSFERFVLSTFLDEILLQANIRLDQMTDHRYQLIRSEELAKRGAQSGLDLEVLDHYTGRKRSVNTLSGGEGFKAALSLALGMADIVQAHAGGVQLDTLFIDEGFGTLDEVSLEQAIKCLKELQQDHRMIGVISHVAQLKEEIKAKLVIEASHTGSTAKFKIG
ncbi:exonuclease SbcC [Gracilibacillus orientalis]|uniref:Nuclease SbcCD subunit C n=1 Tax=Gracilibacillus orientalis TaxID=334253 RepID=A0A1I4L5A2_9BACI|nr:SMC family ATPase [Gracilibacillus orientalis]SFL86215.1 exonuclease SbcC [Gracilibacillus orientalis]